MSAQNVDAFESDVERIARQFHYVYEEMAQLAGWQTQEKSRVPWPQVPEANRNTMLATVAALLERGVIKP